MSQHKFLSYNITPGVVAMSHKLSSSPNKSISNVLERLEQSYTDKRKRQIEESENKKEIVDEKGKIDISVVSSVLDGSTEAFTKVLDCVVNNVKEVAHNIGRSLSISMEDSGLHKNNHNNLSKQD